ncbi:MAG: dihydrodipicolinate synthase family protein [Chloroflexi bacterium]|nr:dihydrodipicolinate synthase family protein [Chloroflexota bacterium]
MGINRLDAKEFAAEHVKGLWGAATTPFHPDGSLDEEGLRHNLRHWKDVLHIDGMYVAGWMGEFESMPQRDRERVVEIACEECSDGKMFAMPSSMDQNILDALELLQHGVSLGATIVAIMNPRFYAPRMPDDDAIVEYYEYLAERLDAAILVVNQSDLQGYSMSPEVISRLADIPNVVALKNAIDDPAHSLRTRQLCHDRIIVSDPWEGIWFKNHTDPVYPQRTFLAAPPVYLLQSRERQAVREYTDLADRGDFSRAKEVSDGLQPAREALGKAIHHVGPDKHRAVMKLWMDLLGQVGGSVRRPGPLRELTEAEKAFTRERFAESGLLGARREVAEPVGAGAFREIG